MQLPYEEIEQEAPTLAHLLQETAFLWKDWPKDMEAVLIDAQVRKFTLRGICPHPRCRRNSAFLLATSSAVETETSVSSIWIAGMTCQACFNYILGIVRFNPYESPSLAYLEHYPLGTPDDAVPEEIPPAIRPDFQEALRCRWVEAFNATVEMCRRALEASYLEQGASDKLVLNDMIDWVHAQGKITTPLKDMAHKIKLGGNRGAHPSDRTLTADDADAVIKFTRNYFENVYVMPASMAKFNFDKPKKKP